jgi:gamma-glutamyl-gamma-aminobutyrate hydrolase PuuD
MTAPLIGVTTSAEQTPRGVPRAFLNASYIRAVERAGGVPVLLTPYHSPAALAALWHRLRGIVLTGGGDVAPARFGEAPHPATALISEERDALELELVTRRAIADAVPLLAICRGLQVLNVALNGTLHQHVPDAFGETIAHSQDGPRHARTHEVTVEPGSLLARVAGADRLRVNSFHHQAIRDLGDGLRAVAWADDKVIEAAELPGAPGFVLGVQWHPEELIEDDPAAVRLFETLIAAAAQRR